MIIVQTVKTARLETALSSIINLLQRGQINFKIVITVVLGTLSLARIFHGGIPDNNFYRPCGEA